MSYYFLAAVDIHDRDLYSTYRLMAAEAFRGLRVHPVRIDQSNVKEGALPATTMALLEFPDEAEFLAWYASDQYQEAITIRNRAADTAFAITFASGESAS